MKVLDINKIDLEEETLILYKGYKFSIKNSSTGQYGFERRVCIFLINDDLTKVPFKNIGILRLFSGNKITKESKSTQCLITEKTTFAECLATGKEYIKTYVDFLT